MLYTNFKNFLEKTTQKFKGLKDRSLKPMNTPMVSGGKLVLETRTSKTRIINSVPLYKVDKLNSGIAQKV